ncbi:MAG: valyl-tRNA synthetase, partial [Parcubacteria group bacterium Gr01-1014_70]
ELEWINGPITATVIKDEAIDMEFGTGVMTITPWHDATDFEIARRHSLDKEQIIDFNGKLLDIAGEFKGIHIKKARPLIAERLKEKGLLEKIDENYSHRVATNSRGGGMIEPQIKEQWFVKMEPLAEMAIHAIEKGSIKFIPDNYRKIFLYWMENTLDWNISRQIVWGIPIPAKLCDQCGAGVPDLDNSITKCLTCGGAVRQDSDTFDTWFSSGQWPYLALGYPNHSDFQTYYPTDVMETGHDLIFRWVPRMVIFGLYRAKEAPFHTVYLHGLVNDAKGKKMSKSKGNVINPLELSKKYGTDALRMGLMVGNTPGTNLSLSEDKIKAYKHFANKIWNASKFVLAAIENADLVTQPKLAAEDQKSLDELKAITEEITADMEAYRLYLAAEKLYHYFWHTFADKIVEEAKPRLRSEDAGGKLSAQWTLLTILSTSLKLLHPFMPFVTETVWGQMPHQKETLLMIAEWPRFDSSNNKDES